MTAKERANRDAIIKAEIERLHKRGSSDWQRLSKQVLSSYKVLEYNLPQMVAAKASVRYKWLFLEWGRGTGKTTYLGHQMRQLVMGMPRSNGLYIGPTYQKILTQMLPSLVRGLEMQGLYKDLHYFIGRKPPKAWKWPTPYMPPDKYDRYIIFFNGAGASLISHDVPGDGRALNTDWEVADESALLSEEKLNQNTLPTLRGSNVRAFKKHPLFGSRLHVSSTPLSAEGQWFVEMEERAILLAEAKKNLSRLSPAERKKVLEQPDIFFLSADCRHNAHNLRKGYLAEARAVTIPWIFDAEYLNIRPGRIKNGFYPKLDARKHAYEAERDPESFTYEGFEKQSPDCRVDTDLDMHRPLLLGLDFGAAINAMVISQSYDKEFRIIRSLYVLGEDKKLQSDLIDAFHKHYQFKQQFNKQVKIWYDSSGNIADGRAKQTRAQEVRTQLTALGWSVQLLTNTSKNPMHNLKHLLWDKILSEEDTILPRFRINRTAAKDCLISMENAKAKVSSSGDIHKDKSSERSKKIKRQHATDLSDAADYVVFGLYFPIFRRHGGANFTPRTEVK